MPTLRYRKYNPDGVMAHRVVWWRLVGAVPVCPPVSPCKGASIVQSLCIIRVFLVWKRRYADVRAGTQAPPLRFRLGGLRVDGWFRLGGLRVNGYFVCVELCGKIWWRLVGAAPMCPPASPSKGASIVKFPARNACIFCMETPLRERSGGHTGTAPTVLFGGLCVGGFVCWLGKRCT